MLKLKKENKKVDIKKEVIIASKNVLLRDNL